MNVLVNGKKYTLGKDTYLAGGGEGNVYVKDNFAFKVYHDSSKALPAGKIHELSVLSRLNNVLVPLHPIEDNGTNIGFVMKYVKNTEFLCKLFTKSFRDRSGITPDTIKQLVKNMQDTVAEIHKDKILIVDLNEMNFLASKTFDTVYFIDTDSYQTASYPATALMESVRDRQVKGKKFTELSDWFSFAVVSFQLYMGCHPYKGRHPNYSPKDWLKMMDDNVSVFDKSVTLPPATQDWSVIPPGHKKWFEKIFNGERLPPPQPDQIVQVAAQITQKVVLSTANFDVNKIYTFKDNILVGRYIDGIFYSIINGTDLKLFADQKELYTIQDKYTENDIVKVQGSLPAVVSYQGSKNLLSIYDKSTKIVELNSTGYFITNKLYAVVNNNLVAFDLIKFGNKIVASQSVVASIFHSHKVFDGFVWQDILGTCRFSIPEISAGAIHVVELDRARLVAGKFCRNFLVAFSEKSGEYYRHILKFAGESYSIYTEKTNLEDINFDVKDNGVCILSADDKLNAFNDVSKIKQFSSPLTGNEQLIVYKNDTYVIAKNQLLQLKSK